MFNGISLTEIEGLVVRHKCDNPPCVNPNHLEVGTQRDNVRDMQERGRGLVGERHPMAKLTRKQVDDIRARHVRGTSRWSPGNTRELCEEFGISDSTLSDIMRGKKWAS